MFLYFRADQRAKTLINSDFTSEFDGSFCLTKWKLLNYLYWVSYKFSPWQWTDVAMSMNAFPHFLAINVSIASLRYCFISMIHHKYAFSRDEIYFISEKRSLNFFLKLNIELISECLPMYICILVKKRSDTYDKKTIQITYHKN